MLHAPDTAGRFYLMPMLSGWTNVFAVPGARTTGTGEGDFAICGPGWEGRLPEGVERIDAPTSLVWILGRTQANGKDDFSFVNGLQDGFTITPLSRFGSDYEAPAGTVDPAINMAVAPVDAVTEMSAREFLEELAELKKTNPPGPDDGAAVAGLERLGVVAGQSFDGASMDDDLVAAVEAGVETAKRALSQPRQSSSRTDGW